MSARHDPHPVNRNELRVLNAISQQAHLNKLLGHEGKHRLGKSYLWRWIETGKTSPFGSPMADPVRMRVTR